MARKRMSKNDRRVQLMDAAARLFARSSYDQVTTAELARAAGVTEPVIYQHFATKLDLYVAVLRRAREMTLEHYAQLEARVPTPLLKLIAVIRAHGNIMRDNEPYFRLHLRALATSEMPRVKQVLRENYLAYNRYFTELIRKAQAQGEVHKAVDAEETAWFIMSQGVMMNLCNQLGLTELQEKGYVDRMLEDALAHIALAEEPLRLLKRAQAAPARA
ncbi:MAG: TetR/AcrR family transcriptional regulator [Planctomycetes bacterium]|jgi:AcrR family transcriptional regulator|nr:TetR/AcrR family transcriptional regulator [Planctomycetota bacterium]MCL4730205.1 TetR/AcrR family transcriptional regulator [Planctomycetota bacterium]